MSFLWRMHFFMTLANKVSIFPRKLQRSVLIEDVTLREMIFEFWVATALACHGHARAAAGSSGYARAATAAHSVVADSQNIVWWPHSKTKSQKNIFTHFRCTICTKLVLRNFPLTFAQGIYLLPKEELFFLRFVGTTFLPLET